MNWDETAAIGELHGALAVAGRPLESGRVYPRALWESVLADPKLMILADRRLLLGTLRGELGYSDEDVPPERPIRPEEAAVALSGMPWLSPEGDVLGTLLILDTGPGWALRDAIARGLHVRAAVEGGGHIEPDGDISHYVFWRFDALASKEPFGERELKATLYDAPRPCGFERLS